MFEIVVGVLTYGLLLWVPLVFSGAVRVLLGDRQCRWGRLDPTNRILRSPNPRVYAAATVLSIAALLLLMLSRGSPPRDALIGLGMLMFVGAGVLLVVADADWTRVPKGYRTPRWCPDPTGQSDQNWYWNGWNWTEERRPSHSATDPQ